MKSPPWHMKSLITRWNDEPLKWRGFPDRPVPFSPVQRHRKFSAVLGTTSERSCSGGSKQPRSEQKREKKTCQTESLRVWKGGRKYDTNQKRKIDKCVRVVLTFFWKYKSLSTFLFPAQRHRGYNYPQRPYGQTAVTKAPLLLPSDT